MFSFARCPPLPARIGPSPSSSRQTPASRGRERRHPSPSRPYPVRWPPSEAGRGAGRADRPPEAGTPTATGAGPAPAPTPRCSRAPRGPCRPGGWGWEREPVLPGTRCHCGLALQPSQGQDDTAAAAGHTGTICAASKTRGSLTAAAPSRSAPFPGPGPPGASPRPPRAPPSPLPPAAPGERGKAAAREPPTPPAPRARPGPAHARLTLCRRRSCCRPVRRRYRSPPFAVSAPRGTRVSEEGPRNITPPAPPPGLSAAPPDRKSHARTRARAHVRRAAPGLGRRAAAGPARSAAHVVRRRVGGAPDFAPPPIVCWPRGFTRRRPLPPPRPARARRPGPAPRSSGGRLGALPRPLGRPARCAAGCASAFRTPDRARPRRLIRLAPLPTPSSWAEGRPPTPE